MKFKPFLGLLLKNSKAFAIIIGLFIFCMVLFNVGKNYALNQEVKRDTSTYISSIYWEINSTTNLLKYIEYWDDSINSLDHTVNPFRYLKKLYSVKNSKQY